MSPSSKSRLAPYWTTKQTLANSLVQFGCVGNQTPKSKVNGPMVHFPYRGDGEISQEKGNQFDNLVAPCWNFFHALLV